MTEANNQPDRCAVCGKDVANGWFARLRNGSGWAKVCSPACSIRYTDALHPADDGVGFVATEHPLRFSVNGELW
jgi:hypothetical protein